MKAILLLLVGFFSTPAFSQKAPYSQRIALEQMKAAVWYLDNSERNGTGFELATSKGNSEFLTAMHVVSDGSSCEPKRLLSVLAKRMAWDPGSREISIRFPGKQHCSYAQDAVKRAMKRVAPLPLVREGERLVAGEPLLIGGFPSFSEGQFRVYRCFFRGYGLGINSELNMIGHAECPGLKNDLEGMSGGPVFSLQKNKVIGVFIAQETSMGKAMMPHVFFGAVSEGKDNQVRFDFPSDDTTAICSKHGEYRGFPCSVKKSGMFRFK